ncbi:DUF445 domain-containing protein [Akkermansiaceae bacterium]|nr:DUF445 domain-containing protein [Akkermansiaceae bacterium]MDB4569531.1 DUF445 domain-containing protein [Akkermansiaceae bacterium]
MPYFAAVALFQEAPALFRHPLGLPIPHTAIVRREKARVGRMISRFLRRSFLSPAVVREQWGEHQPLHKLVKMAAKEENERALALRVEKVAPSFLAAVSRSGFATSASELIEEGLQKMPVGKAIRRGLETLLENPRRRELIAPVLGRLAQIVESQSGFFVSEAEREAPFQETKLLGALTRGVTRAFSGRAVEKAGAKLAEASQDQTHPLYDRIEESLREAIDDLRSGSKTLREWDRFKERLLSDPETRAGIESFLRNSGDLLSEELLAGEESPRIVRMLREVAVGLEGNDELLEQWENRLGELVEGVLQKHGDQVESLVSGMVERWDADALIDTLETHVGPDLQFIRINGTLIGGCVGLLLHGFGLLIWA